MLIRWIASSRTADWRAARAGGTACDEMEVQSRRLISTMATELAKRDLWPAVKPRLSDMLIGW